METFHVEQLPDPTPEQEEKLHGYVALLHRMNRTINLVSRAEAADLYDRHIRQCLVLRHANFLPGEIIADWGTGGGLPAIPLAICFPEVYFVGIDAVGKKTEAVQYMADRLGLHNVSVWHGRAEAYQCSINHSVSRATAPLLALWNWHCRVAPVGASLWCLKGGDLHTEVAELHGAYPAVTVRRGGIPVDAFQGSDGTRYLIQLTG